MQICDKSFAAKGTLNIHIESVHEDKKAFKCNACVKSFAQKIALNRHCASFH